MIRSHGGGAGGAVERGGNAPPPHDPGTPSASFCPAVKHPPAEPSRFVSVPAKMPDKMGFDEVGRAFWGREGEGWGT